MDNFQIQVLLHHKNTEPQFTHYKREYLEGIAAGLGRTFDGLGGAVYRIAAWLEVQGNRGMSVRYIDDGLEKDVLANKEHSPAWDGILFCNRDKDWFARKRPHWTLVWGERYGWQSELGQVAMALHHQEALATHAEVLAYFERLKPKRIVETIAGNRAESLTTIQVAYVAAVADVLYRRYRRQSYGVSFDDVAGILRWHYQALNNEARAELQYRTQSGPEERASKKKTAAAVEDWKKAGEMLNAGTDYFFDPAFIQQAIESAAEPDLQVDFDHLPKLPAEQTPVKWLTDGDLVLQFMKWVDAASEPNSFEWEDKQAIMRQLRAMFARAKGQKLDDEIVISGKDGD